MAPPKKKKSQLSDSAKYYRENPDARKKKNETTSKLNSKPEQKAKRRELANENYKRDKAKGGSAHRAGKDLSHTSKGLVYKSSSANRGSKSDTKGDSRARGKKK